MSIDSTTSEVRVSIMRTTIGVVTVNVDKPSITSNMVSSLAKDNPDIKFCVVDNGSDSQNYVLLIQRLSYLGNVIVKRLEQQASIGKAFNIGIMTLAEQVSLIVLMHNNCFIDKTNLHRLAQTLMLNDSKISIIAPLIMSYYNPKEIWSAGHSRRLWRGDTKPYTQKFNVETLDGPYYARCVSLACMMVKSYVFRKVGYLDEFLAGNEEADFCLRAWRGHCRVAVDPRSRAYHMVGTTSKIAGGSRGPIKPNLVVSAVPAYFRFLFKNSSRAQMVSSIIFRGMTLPRTLRDLSQ
ncbi:MAG: glycosyltransferase [Conexivisphaerales archaeon]